MIDVKKELQDNADKKYKSFQGKVVRGAAEVLGVTMPVLKDLSKRICEDDWRSFLNESPVFYEDYMLRALVIATAKMDFDERLKCTKIFVPEIDNWAVCDAFCSNWKVKNPDKERFWSYCEELFETNDEFKMRVGSVMMQYHFMDAQHIDKILQIHTVKDHPGYYYRMGSAWTLSTCFIYFPDKTEMTLLSDALNNDVRNKAVQKIIESARVDQKDKERLKQKKGKL